jgi:hypothetical protein
MGRFSADRPVMPVRPARGSDLDEMQNIGAPIGVHSSAEDIATFACFVADTGATVCQALV